MQCIRSVAGEGTAVSQGNSRRLISNFWFLRPGGRELPASNGVRYSVNVYRVHNARDIYKARPSAGISTVKRRAELRNSSAAKITGPHHEDASGSALVPVISS